MATKSKAVSKKTVKAALTKQIRGSYYSKRSAWLPQEPQPITLSERSIQIIESIARRGRPLTVPEIEKALARKGVVTTANQIYVYTGRLTARGILLKEAPAQGGLLTFNVKPGRVVPVK